MSKIDDVSKSVKNATRAFSKLGPAASAAIASGKLGSPFDFAEKEAYRQQRLINEIACIIETSRGEVEEFYKSHPFDLGIIKKAALLGAGLDKDEIVKAFAEHGFVPTLDLALKKTWGEWLSDIPYYGAHYAIYPFAWLIYWLCEGFRGAWVDVWEGREKDE